MTRKTIDCRDFPGPCTLAISGEEDEVVDAQTAHLATVHDMADKPEPIWPHANGEVVTPSGPSPRPPRRRAA